MIIHKTDDFLDNTEHLPKDAQRILKRQEELFRNNWLDPRLHIKKLKEADGVIGHRKEIYK